VAVFVGVVLADWRRMNGLPSPRLIQQLVQAVEGVAAPGSRPYVVT
jgi:hypothetical protein